MSKQLFHSRNNCDANTPPPPKKKQVRFLSLSFFSGDMWRLYTQGKKNTHTTHELTKFYQFLRNMNFIIMKCKYSGINWISAVIFRAVYNPSQIQM